MTTPPPTTILKDAERRGPTGTELMGVSIAMPLKEAVDPATGIPWTQEDWAAFIREARPQLLDMLKRHVGGARFTTEPQMSVDGPHSDPLQGQLYVMSCAAWFYPAQLPVDSSAYRARQAAARDASHG